MQTCKHGHNIDWRCDCASQEIAALKDKLAIAESKLELWRTTNKEWEETAMDTAKELAKELENIAALKAELAAHEERETARDMTNRMLSTELMQLTAENDRLRETALALQTRYSDALAVEKTLREALEEIGLEPYDDSDLGSLLLWIRRRAKAALGDEHCENYRQKALGKD